MLDLDFMKFLIAAGIISIGIVVLDILWLIIRASWQWIDDGDKLEGKSIGRWWWISAWEEPEHTFDTAGPGPWVTIVFAVFFIIFFLWAALSFYYISIVIGILVVIAHLARFTKRLSKKLTEHTKNIDAHTP